MRLLETLSWADISEALSAQPVGEPRTPPRGASIDTRTLEPGDMFFALEGEHTDGHDHLQAALDRGASCAVVRDRGRVPPGLFALVVEDPEKALLELGRLIRSRSTARFVAITGSAGKTTAKEFTTALLSSRGPVLSTRGNLNNHLGVPLTLARLQTDHWAAVLECGMSHKGELSLLARLVRPKVAAVTNVAAVHLEFFDSVEQIAEAKSEIFETMGPGDTAVAPAEEPLLRGRAVGTAASASLFGYGPGAAIRAEGIEMSLTGSNFEMVTGEDRIPVHLAALGPHSISNFLAAAAIARALGIPAKTMASLAPGLQSGGNRGAVRRLRDDILLIDDTYNSNPWALRSAIETLSLAQGRRRVACVGDMLELGATGPELHRETGAAIGPSVDLLLGVGPLSAELLQGAATLSPRAKHWFKDSGELAAQVSSLVKSQDAVLVKGSRGIRMERVVDALVAAHPGVSA